MLNARIFAAATSPRRIQQRAAYTELSLQVLLRLRERRHELVILSG
jgi:hypothetical protein